MEIIRLKFANYRRGRRPMDEEESEEHSRGLGLP